MNLPGTSAATAVLLATPVLLGVLAGSPAARAGAAPKVYQSAQGLGVSVGECFVQFDQQGKLLRGGQKCDDIQLNTARKALRNYHAH